mgnify:CR=1 FL=1
MGNNNLAKIVGIGAGVALGSYLAREYSRRQKAYKGNFSPLIDYVKVATDGIPSERWHFAWDDEERCKNAIEERLDSRGHVTQTRQLIFDFREYEIEVAEYIDEADTPNEVTYLTLDDFDVVTNIVTKQDSGQQQRYDLTINGAELSELSSEEGTSKMYWHNGNLEGISYFGEARQKMTYYKNKENYIFPDINLFINGFDVDLLTTYLLGTRSRNFLRSVVTSGADRHQQSHISYLLDSFDRPIQILVEQTEVNNNISTNSSKEFEIKYKRI